MCDACAKARLEYQRKRFAPKNQGKLEGFEYEGGYVVGGSNVGVNVAPGMAIARVATSTPPAANVMTGISSPICTASGCGRDTPSHKYPPPQAAAALMLTSRTAMTI